MRVGRAADDADGDPVADDGHPAGPVADGAQHVLAVEGEVAARPGRAGPRLEGAQDGTVGLRRHDLDPGAVEPDDLVGAQAEHVGEHLTGSDDVRAAGDL